MVGSRTSTLRRLSLLAIVLAVFAVAMVGPQQRSAAAVCDDFNIVTITYYNNASHQTVVGSCHHGCCQTWTCTGDITDYDTVVKISCN